MAISMGMPTPTPRGPGPGRPEGLERQRMRQLLQAWPRPAHPRPIVLVGAGGNVRGAYLLAYRRLAFPVAGIFDVDRQQAGATAQAFSIATVFPSLEAGGATPGVGLEPRVPG